MSAPVLSSAPSFLQLLVNIEPEASQVRLTALPSNSWSAGDAVTETCDILSVGHKWEEYVYKKKSRFRIYLLL